MINIASLYSYPTMLDNRKGNLRIREVDKDDHFLAGCTFRVELGRWWHCKQCEQGELRRTVTESVA